MIDEEKNITEQSLKKENSFRAVLRFTSRGKDPFVG